MKNLKKYEQNLTAAELAPASISKYLADAKELLVYVGDQELTKELMINYKQHLQEQGFATSTLNSKIIGINKYLNFLNLDSCKVKNIRVQTRDLDNVLSQNDYERMLRQANDKGTDRDYLMLETFYRAGLRVSELEQFTVEAVKYGYMDIDHKGKIRRVPISKSLEKLAKTYIKKHDIKSGAIILNRQGKPLSRSYIFKRIKYLAGQARIKLDKAYPHSIRHLFAKNWIERNGDRVTQLADILGHESLETTRIYTKLSVDEARLTMD